MSESFARAVASFQKACFDLRRRPPTPEEIQALRELSKKQGNKWVDEESFIKETERLTESILRAAVPTVDETRALQEAVIESLGCEIDEADWAAIEEKLEKKGNKPMDEELFQRVEVDIEKFTRAAMELQVAVINAEAQLQDAKQQWVDVEDALEKARGSGGSMWRMRWKRREASSGTTSIRFAG